MPSANLQSFFNDSWILTAQSHPVTVITYHREYPHILVQRMHEYLAAAECNTLMIDMHTWDISNKELLYTMFLGQQQTIVLHVANDGLTGARLQFLNDIIQTYRGPNTLLCIIPQALELSALSAHPEHALFVALPEHIDIATYVALLEWFNIKITDRMLHGMSNFFVDSMTLGFDHALLLTMYIPLITDYKIFCEQWLPLLSTTEQSLFVLSTAFFQKNTKLFFAQWTQYERQYEQSFWVSFWFDQLWRASLYVHAMHAQKHNDAKIARAKLPFSFINRDWKQYTSSELIVMCDWLYAADYKIKNGLGAVPWDLFFAMVFNKGFDQSNR